MLNEISRTAFVSLANVQGLGPPHLPYIGDYPKLLVA